MNTYKVTVTNTENVHESMSEEIQASDITAVMDIAKSWLRLPDVEFQHGNRYIVIFEASDEGYMYDIYDNIRDYKDGHDSLDGGQCTSTLSNAIEMALSQA